ncbi:energy transducer TonB [Woodsholea maritima]|uniref:energy transducer TonB n=1 Tax=Woodsholea maritima TaxID=240237 RepID=UPI0003674233|nr:energy transducer TonB [Woodsholea maritima]
MLRRVVQGVSLAMASLAVVLLSVSAMAQPQRTPVEIVPPEYPRGAERRNIEGHVEIRYSITASGETTNMEVTASEPAGIFDRAALRAIEQWKFEPADAQSDGHVQELNFSLGG